MKSSLQTKFLLWLLPLVVGSFVVFFGICYYMSSQAMLRDADVIARAVGQEAVLEIEKTFQKKVLALESLAINHGVTYGDRPQRQQALVEFMDRTEGYAMLAYSNPMGIAYDQTGRDIDRSSRDYIKAVRETKKPFMTGPFVAASTGNLITSIAMPVMRDDRLEGIVFGTIELDTMSDIVGRIKYMESGYVFIVDEAGMVIADAHHPEIVGKLDITKPGSEQAIDPALVSAYQKTLESDGMTMTECKDENGIQMQAVMAPVHLGYRTWVAVGMAPLSEIYGAANSLAWVMGVTAVVMILLIAAVIWLVVKKLCAPVGILREECEIINKGDLRDRPLSVTSEDELGQLAKGFADMRNTMRKLLREIQINAEKVSASSEELTAAAHQSAEASNHVAVAITEIAGGISSQSDSAAVTDETAHAMADRMTSVADNANAIAVVTNQTVERVGDGRGAIQTIVDAMGSINESAATVQSSITELAKRSDEISNIVELISNIADQTNLLALNAAIEAARAGEHGRGFAVVAEEVRKLAEESANSSRKIADIVSQIQVDMGGAVDASKLSAESVANSMKSVTQADSIFESIKVSIESLAGGIGEVSKSIQEISDGIHNMQKEVSNINEVSHSNAARAESVSATTEEQSASTQEIAAASRSLSELAQALASEVGKFKVS